MYDPAVRSVTVACGGGGGGGGGGGPGGVGGDGEQSIIPAICINYIRITYIRCEN